jgi:peptide/nickel transport system permease protein
MGKYITKRILLLIPSVLVVCIIVFASMRMLPGSAVDVIYAKYTGMGMTVDKDTIKAMLGLDKPAFQQFFIWLGNVARGDLGQSFYQQMSVTAIIAKKLPISLELGLLILILTNLVSVPLGVITAAKQDSMGDYVLRIISIILMAIPVFWIGTLVLIYPAKWFGYAPPISYYSFFQDPTANIQMFLIPSLLGALTQCGMQMRMVRTSVLDVMRQDYVRTARSKGLKDRTVLFGHAFRNSLIPVITLIGGSVAGLVGGSVILENMFNIPGIGSAMVDALNTYDYPVVEGCVLVFAIFVMLINLLVDIAYKWCDPRVKLD